MGLKLTRRIGETVRISHNGEELYITVVQRGDRVIKLDFSGTHEMEIVRLEALTPDEKQRAYDTITGCPIRLSEDRDEH